MFENCCAFTGHRPKKFPWDYDETDPRCAALKKALAGEIARLADAGYTDFLSGMAEGTDTYSNPRKYSEKFSSPGIAWLRCRP